MSLDENERNPSELRNFLIKIQIGKLPVKLHQIVCTLKIAIVFRQQNTRDVLEQIGCGHIINRIRAFDYKK